MNTPTIRLEGLTTGYKDKVVTRDINAALYGGELTCLLGPNGAGKSTLLKTLCVFLPALAGRIFINDELLSSIGSRRLAQTLGVVLTERPAAMNMTVEELVAIGRSPYTSFFGTLRSEDRRIVDESIALVGIEDLRGRGVSTLSDGERQKVMIAKALAQQTQIIFLDEPTAFLDYPSKVEILKLLHRLAHEQHKTIFLSTHDMELALQIADKIWLLDKERGLRVGIPEDLACLGLLEDYFLREGLLFNRLTGLFEIEHPQLRQVRLTGEGILYNMTRKALNRVGISELGDEQNPWQIEIRTDSQGVSTLYLNGSKLEGIESLLARLNEL